MKLTMPKTGFESVLCGLLFLFPLFAVGVRHWVSIIFGLVILLGIIYYFTAQRKEPASLHKYEKLLLWFLVTYFVVFVISMLFNPAESIGRSRFGNEVRFVLVIPLYFLLARYQQGLRCLVAGSAGAVIVGFGFCLYELYVENQQMFRGEYDRLFTGPVLLLNLMLVLGYYIPRLTSKDTRQWLFLAVLVGIATFSIVSTSARVAYLGYLFLAFMFILLYIKGAKRFIILGILIVCMATLSIFSESVSHRMSRAYTELVNYFQKVDPDAKRTDISYAGTSVGVRLEMWRVAPLFVKDYPLFGVGNGNYHSKVLDYIEQGKINPDMARHDHPHNVFLNAIYNKGIVGLISTCLVFFFPLYVYIKTYKVNKYSAATGILFIVAMFTFSMNESAPFLKSNFLAIYLVFGLVIFQNHMARIKGQPARE